MRTAIQLFTLRDDYSDKESFKRVLGEIKEMGYEGVEFAGYAGMQAGELREYLKEISLVPVSAHCSAEDISVNADKTFSFLKELGCGCAVLAYSETDSIEKVEETCGILKKAEEKAAEYGIKVGYHNHSHEFRPLPDGSLPIERIAKSSCLEPVTYWVYYAGTDPAGFLTENADNIILVHLKDGDSDGHPLALGEGVNKIREIVKASEKIGMDWLIVENDNPVPDGLKDAERSIKYLKKLL